MSHIPGVGLLVFRIGVGVPQKIRIPQGHCRLKTMETEMSTAFWRRIVCAVCATMLTSGHFTITAVTVCRTARPAAAGGRATTERRREATTVRPAAQNHGRQK